MFLCQRYHPEDGRITDRNMLVKINKTHQIAEHLLVVVTFITACQQEDPLLTV
jgi:hypothetical protein